VNRPVRGTDVVIVGAGIAGIAAAWSLSERAGDLRIVVVDPRQPLSLTSHRREANYRTWWPQESMVRLATRSLDLIEDLRNDGADIPMDQRGYLYLSDDPATWATLADIVAGHPATRISQAVALDGDQLRRSWPHLGRQVTGGILVRRAGGLDTVALGLAMLECAEARGVRVVNGEVVDVDSTGGRIAGVRIATIAEELRLPADILLDAAGPFARDVAGLARVDLPLETVLRQKVVIRDAAKVIPRDAPFTITLDPRPLPWTEAERSRLAMDPESRRLLGRLRGGIHLKPDDTSGDDAIKLGWAWDQTPSPPVVDPACPPEFVRMVLLGASTVVPGLVRYADALANADPTSGLLLAHDGGFYARTPDGRPLIGPAGAGAPDGLHVVAGLAGYGAMMATAAGELAADWIAPRPGSGTSANLPFDPGRFHDPAYLETIRAGVVTGEL
jgi:glycine/D-amino acid oxidase-like deaminating enzyme